MPRRYSGPHPEGSEEFSWSDHLSLLSLSPSSGQHLSPGNFSLWVVWPGQKGEERVGMNPLLSDHVEGDLQVCRSGLEHSCLLLGTRQVPRLSAISTLLSMVTAEGKTCEAVVTGVFFPWTEHGKAIAPPNTTGAQGPCRRQRDCPGKPVSVHCPPACLSPPSPPAEHRHSYHWGRQRACPIARGLQSVDVTWARWETRLRIPQSKARDSHFTSSPQDSDFY